MSGHSTKNLRMFRKLCGEPTTQNDVVITNMWGEVDPIVGEARKNELKHDEDFFKPILDGGALMIRHGSTRTSAHNTLRHILKNYPLPLQVQRELVDEKKDISETAAGTELSRELMDQITAHKKEMDLLHEELQAFFLYKNVSWFKYTN